MRSSCFCGYSLQLQLIDTPLPPPPGCSGIIDLARNSLQNREPKGVRVIIRETKDLRPVLLWLDVTGSALTIIC
jgi:hypothetical protein